MRIIGIDPGVTTGFAIYIKTKEGQDGFSVRTFIDINDLIDAIIGWKPDLTIIEDFNSSGFLNKERKITIMTIGAVLATTRFINRPVIKHAPQHRRAYLDKARSMYPSASIHSIDALAHVLASIATSEHLKAIEQASKEREK